MSRTMLCAITAAGLITVSLAMMAGRYRVLGDEVLVPKGPRTWKVTMKIDGKSAGNNARLMTLTPLDFAHQHIQRESFQSHEMLSKPPTARHPQRREVLWSPKAGVREGAFSATYSFYCDVDVRSPSAPMTELAKTLQAPPSRGEQLEAESLMESDHHAISDLAQQLVEGRDSSYDQLQAFYQYVDERVHNEPSVGIVGIGALECLAKGRGDALAKSRLLVALCRNRGIPARLVTGLTLTKGPEQTAHTWVEAWVREHWRPMCPFYHHLGRVPATYLVFGFGDQPVVRGRNVADLDYAFLVEHTAPEQPAAGATVETESTAVRRIVKQLSLDALPGPERRLVEFLLLVPLAALIVCLFRNVIGLNSFGTFAPALIGLAFRDLHSLPGIMVFISIVLLGWGLRRVLDAYHLLQVPRTAVMLTLVVIVLITAIVAANYKDLEATKYIPLFPIVILTGMIERFWTLEVEDGTTSSFRTLLGTMFIATCIALLLSREKLVSHMVRFPETLGLVMAVQLLIGRYTGYRLSELFRFRDFLRMADA